MDILNMPSDMIGRLILQELMNIRNDMKQEMKRLGDRIENYLGTQSEGHQEIFPSNDNHNQINVNSPTDQTICKGRYGSNCNADETTFDDVLQPGSAVSKDNFVEDSPMSDEDSDEKHNQLQNFQTASDIIFNVKFIEERKSPKKVKVLDEENTLRFESSNDETNLQSTTESIHVSLTHKNFDLVKKKKEISKSLVSATSSAAQSLMPAECTICHKVFKKKSYLSQHRRIHFAEKKFGCTVCGKSFRRKIDLRRHEIIHTGEKPFHCYHCGKAFQRSDQLKNHNQRVHAVLSITENSALQYY